MTQASVLEFLEKKKRPMTIRQIREEMGIRSIDKNIAALKKNGEIKWVWKIIKIDWETGSIERPILHYFV